MTIFHAPNLGELPPHPLVPRLLKQDLDAQSIADRWISEAGAMGVSMDFHLAPGRQNPFEAILAAARRGPYSLIAMEDKSSALSTSIIGSNTRQVVRRAPCPVLVLAARSRKSAPHVLKGAA
jgi:nucleotide-binding universal stress UspA family protein